jgi:hypothetical protein
VTIGASAADVLSVAAGEITADDAGSDKLLFWDDSGGKLTHLALGTNLSVTDTTIDAVGSPPGGSDGQIQFNDGGAFGGDVDLTYNKTTNKLTTKGDVELNDGGTFTTTVQVVTPTANRTISYPNATGTIGLVAGSSGQLLYNASGANAGASTLTYDGSILTSSGRFINSYNATASSPAKAFTGTWFTGGTSTTTKPQVLIEPTGATSTAWSTSGTGLGVNAASGFAGNLLDLQVNGTRYFSITGTTSTFNPPPISIGLGHTLSALGSTAIGRAGIASGMGSFCLSYGADGPTTTSAEGAIGIGRSNTASGEYGTAIGINQTASGNFSLSLGGRHNAATAVGGAAVVGGYYGRADKAGQFAHGIDRFAADGDAQWSVLGFRGSTADGSVTEIFLNGIASARATVPASTTWMADVTAIARSSGGTDNACFKRRCIIKRDASNNTALVGSVQIIDTDIGSNSGAPPAGWAVTITANDTNEALKVDVTGAAATNIRWVVQVNLLEVGFA